MARPGRWPGTLLVTGAGALLLRVSGCLWVCGSVEDGSLVPVAVTLSVTGSVGLWVSGGRLVSPGNCDPIGRGLRGSVGQWLRVYVSRWVREPVWHVLAGGRDSVSNRDWCAVAPWRRRSRWPLFCL